MWWETEDSWRDVGEFGTEEVDEVCADGEELVGEAGAEIALEDVEGTVCPDDAWVTESGGEE